jgi:NNP family nitrate/nitrite transporter-like MFS transporter
MCAFFLKEPEGSFAGAPEESAENSNQQSTILAEE